MRTDPNITAHQSRHHGHRCTPNPLRPTPPYVSVNRRKWPIRCTPNVTVLDWVAMGVIHMPLEISVVADEMLPEASLLDAAFTLPLTALANPPDLRDRAGKSCLD